MGRFRRNSDDDNQEKPSSRRFGRRDGGDDDKKDDKKSSSRFGRRGGGDDDKKDDSGGRRFGSSSGGRSTGGDSSGGRTFGGSRGSDNKDDDGGGRRSPFGGSSSEGRTSSPFSRDSDSGGGRTFGSSRGGDDKKDDKSSGSGRFSRSSGGSSGGGDGSGSRFSRGDDKKDDKKSGSSRFGRSSGGSSGGGSGSSNRFGSRGSDDKKDDKKTGSSRFGRSSGGSSGGGSGSSNRFGSRGGDDKKDDKKSGSSRFGRSGSSSTSGGSGSSGRFGRGDDKKDDKKSSSGRFSRGGDDKKSSSSGRFGRGDDKKDDKQSGGGGRFSRGNKDDKKDAKPATATGRFGRGSSDSKKDDKKSGGGIAGRFRRGGGDDKKSARSSGSSNKRDLPKQKGTARNVTTGLDLDRKLDIAGFMMLAVGVFLGLGWLQAMTSSADVEGITGTVDQLMSQLFGDGRIVVAGALIYVGGWLILRFFGTMFDIDYYRLAGRGLMFITLLATLQWWSLLFLEFPGKINYVPDLESLHRQSDQLWQDGGGGGVIGHELYMLLMNFNDYGVVVMLVFAWILSLYLGFELSLERTSNYVIATRNARAAKRAERAVAEPEPQPVEAKPAPVSQPALATASASGTSTSKVEDKPQRRSLFGRGGRTEAPSNAPITADTDGDTPKRAVAEEKQTAGRIQVPTDAPITADTDSDTPKRRGLFGRGGRKQAPQAVAENTSAATATTTKVEDEKSGPQRRGLFGRRGRDQETGQVETTAATTGRRQPAEATDESGGIRPQGRRRFGSGDSEPVETVTATPASADAKPDADQQPARRTAAESTSAPAGRRTIPADTGKTAEQPAATATPSTGGKATDLQPAFSPPADKPADAKPAVASKPVTDAKPEESKDKADLVTAAVTGASVAAASLASDKATTSTPVENKDAKQSDAKPAQPRSATTSTEQKPVETEAKATAKPDDTGAKPVEAKPAATETTTEEPVVTAKPRGLFNRDQQADAKPTEREVKPAPKPAAQAEPKDAVATQTVEPDKESAVAMPAASNNKPAGLSDAAFAAVNAATASSAPSENQDDGDHKSKSEQAEEELEAAKTEATAGRWRRPDYLKLLEEGSEQTIEQQILLQRAQTIEDTLISFGAPGKVVEVNTGPVITQFGVEPDYIERRNGSKSRVKVSAIAGLEKDIALALAAKAIRIEAPVPGKGYVGIEVPNAEAAVVSLRDVMMSDHHKKKVAKSKLSVGLGRKVDGDPITADLTSMPHLLIAGATGSGKSVCVNAIIACLLLQNTPEELQFIMVDPKRVELAGYNGIPHLVSPVVVDLERIVGVLKWVQREMDDRYRRFANVGARNIIDFNENKLPADQDKLPYLVVIVDELADLMMLAPDETERLIARLAQMARATGIHLIISTQRPSVDVVTGLIKANFPARIAFAVASSVDSRVIIDQPGAEKLLGRGDILFQAPDAPAPTRMQGAYLSDAEINRITHYWKSVESIRSKNGTARKAGSLVTEGQNVPQVRSRSDRFRQGGRRSGNQQQDFWDQQQASTTTPRRPSSNGDGEDDLFDQAVDLVRQQNRASIAMLQRNFRIGHDRAMRLMQILEEKGIVKAEADATAVREVLPVKE